MSPLASRRAFLESVAAGTLATAVLPRAFAARPPASERVTLGVIGTGNQGFNDIRGFLADERVRITAVCDVNRGSHGYWAGKLGGREPARQLVNEHYRSRSVTSGTSR